MASIRDFKKETNFVIGDIIESIYQWEVSTGNRNSEEGTVLIDKAIAIFDDLIISANDKKVENKKEHFKNLRNELKSKSEELMAQMNNLSSSV